MRVLLAFTIALVLAGTAAATRPRIVGIGEQQDREDAEAHVGDTLVVSLGAKRPTGYSWKVATVNRSVLRLDSSGYVPGKHALAGGSTGVDVLIFKVLALGKTTLKLNYVSAGTPRKVADDYVVVIRVIPRGT